ncbi:histidine-type phosphatase [Dyella sp. 2RAB6]|uniref:histidine-type phosphatase n=1 Tax=Dyella sp. 2RAB6 TaxID=3232992 RepID=UPI003F8ED5C0
MTMQIAIYRRLPHVAAWLLLGLCMALVTSRASAATDGMQPERVVLLYRHGVRTPLPGEIQLDEASGKPWPAWKQPPSQLTPHGIAGVKLMGAYDRQRLAALGLFAPRGCPSAGQLWFWANTDQRTIDSAAALAEGFAPGCHIGVGHKPQGSEDPLFHPIEAKTTEWNAADAVASIQGATGGPDALTAPHADALAALAQVMGCGGAHDPAWCAPGQWHGNLSLASGTGHMLLTGPIATTSGTAEAILMAYAEGRPLPEVGWGRTDAQRLQQLSQLHALLFDIHARPGYMAERVASSMSRRLLELLSDQDAPRLSVLVGSDNNIVALAAVLGLHFQLGGYAKDDPPIGGALGIELWKDAAGKRFVRLFYQAQSLDQLRELRALSDKAPPAIVLLVPAGCEADKPCPLETVLPALERAASHAREAHLAWTPQYTGTLLWPSSTPRP